MMFVTRANQIESRYSTAGQLAQGVQVSAFPSRYDARKVDAMALIARMQDSSEVWPFMAMAG
jgi:hypothetical protein